MKKLEILKYDNHLQALKISPFKLNEAKLFFKLLKGVQNNIKNLLSASEKEISISFQEIREVIKWNGTKEDFHKLLNGLIQKCLSNLIIIDSEQQTDFFVMFTGFTKDKLNKKIIIQINDKFLTLLNDLLINYSTLNLNEIIQLKSKFSLILYKKIREFYNNKFYRFYMPQFKNEFGLKENVRWEYINIKVLKPIEKELSKLFNNFEIIKEKKGRNIKSILFSWDIKNNNTLNDI